MDIMTALFDEEEVTRRYGLSIAREKAEDIARNLTRKKRTKIRLTRKRFPYKLISKRTRSGTRPKAA